MVTLLQTAGNRLDFFGFYNKWKNHKLILLLILNLQSLFAKILKNVWLSFLNTTAE